MSKSALYANEMLFFSWRSLLTADDSHKCYPVTFELPSAALGMRVTVRYSGEGNYLGLCLYEKNRFRAHGRMEKKNGLIELKAEVWAKKNIPGAIAGPLSAGTWQAEITTNKVKQDCQVELFVDVWWGGSNGEHPPIPPRPEKISTTPGWYRGDLHVHSTESDGKKSVGELFEIAAEQGMHFLALTDHNNICNWWKLPSRTQGVLPLPSMEITTFLGHANAFGIRDWVDWRVGKDGRIINEVIDEVHEKGGLFSINHPCTPGLPDDHASWRHKKLDWHKVDALEVWNAPVFSRGEGANRQCRKLWDRLLNQGLRITGLGGSDAHYLEQSVQPMGLPTNYVYLHELSREGLLEGIKNGHVFVTRGPEIHFYAFGKKNYTLPGGEIKSNGKVRLYAGIQTHGLASLALRFIKNGKVVAEMPVSEDKRSYNLEDTCRAGDWYRVELEENGAGGYRLAAFTNPIYIKAD